MREAIKLAMLVPVVAVLGLAGPPGGGGHSSTGGGGHAISGRAGGSPHYAGPPAISGPAPFGASGSAPFNSVGSLRPSYGYNSGLAYGGRGAGTNRFGSRYPYGYYPFVLPFYGYGGYGDDYYDNSYAPTPDYGPGPDQPLTANEEVLGEQLQQLHAELQDLRYQQQQQGQAAAPVAPPSAQQSDSDAQNDVPITVVLHSGQQLQVKNYAVTDGEFWDFSKHPAQKIPVAAIDVPASEKATAASGGDFPPISQ